MLIVEPVLAHVTLQHEIVYFFRGVRLLTVTVDIVEAHIVTICVILVILTLKLNFLLVGRLSFLIRIGIEFIGTIDFASIGKLSIPTVTSKVEFAVQLMPLVTFMAMDHASNTDKSY